MWFRTQPKPVDALLTLLMSFAFQCAAGVLKIAYLVYGLFPHLDIKVISAVPSSFLCFLGGLVKLLIAKEEQKREFNKIMRWNWRLVYGLSFVFVLEVFWILKLLKIL